MNSKEELKFIVEALAKAPFNKVFNIYELNDSLTPAQLLQVITDVCAHIDEKNTMTHSSIKHLDIKNEETSVITHRLGGFLHMLKYPSLYSYSHILRDV